MKNSSVHLRKKWKILFQLNVRILTQVEHLRKLWELFNPLEVKARLYEKKIVLRPSELQGRSETEAVAAAAVLVAQSCLTGCDPTNCSPPRSSLHGTLQVRILEWIVGRDRGLDSKWCIIQPRSKCFHVTPYQEGMLSYQEGVVLLMLGDWCYRFSL